MKLFLRSFALMTVFTLIALSAGCSAQGGVENDGANAAKTAQIESAAKTNDSVITPIVIDGSSQSGEDGPTEEYVPRIIDLDGDMNINDSDFDDSVKYTYNADTVAFSVANGNFTNVSGGIFGEYTANAALSMLVSTTESSPFPYGTFSVDIKTVQGTDNGIVFALSSDKDNFIEGQGISFYYYFLSMTGDAYLGKSVNGEWTPLKTVSYSFNEEDFYNLKIVFQGKKICCYVDNTLLFAIRDDDVLSGTRFGLLAKGAGTVYKNIAVSSNYVLR